MAESSPRPTQVTIAGWLVMGGSVFVVLLAFDQIAALRSMETREAVESFLREPLGRQLGLGLQDALSLMRVLTMVAAACATAAAILGFQVLRRSRSARLVLTVLAAPLFLTGMVVGGLVPAMVTGAITMLWFQPARDWLDGKAPRPVAAPQRPVPPFPSDLTRRAPDAEAPPHTPSAQQAATSPDTSSTPAEPRPVSGFGEAPEPRVEVYMPVHQGRALQRRAGWDPVRGPARPAALTWACALAWAGSALAFVGMLASVLLVLAAPDMLMDELYRQNPQLRDDGVTLDTLRTTVIVAGALLLVWSLAAIVLAAFAWQGRTWAWTALLVSAACSAVLCLLAMLGNPVMILGLVLCGTAVPLLLRPEVREYVRFRSAR